MNVPTYEEFEALQKQLSELRQQVRYLMGNQLTWLTIEQATKALNCSRATLHRLTKQQKLIPRYQNKKPLYEVAQVRAFIESTRVSPGAANKRILAATHATI
ncbi:helix-turn-helix domain-containing protein [Spirosoma flavum]|uniref:Helix-turn-helix domain-containing protein n=1 Tax=Spirosoma flavum TaxID=2048557 RepID=A0ABW6AQX6_9BACT